MNQGLCPLTVLTLLTTAALSCMNSGTVRCTSGVCASDCDSSSGDHFHDLDEKLMLQLRWSSSAAKPDVVPPMDSYTYDPIPLAPDYSIPNDHQQPDSAPLIGFPHAPEADIATPAAAVKRDAGANLKSAMSDSPFSHQASKVLAGTDTQGRDSNSNGNTLPQIKMPWGFNDWAPETTYAGEATFDDAWWFHRGDKNFRGMRCTHQPSPWLGDYANFLLQPHVSEKFRTLSWSPETAIFRPYLFNATIEGIQFEFVPTSHAAILRLNFPETANVTRLSVSLSDGSVYVRTNTSIQGAATHNSGGVPRGWEGMFFTVRALSRIKSVPFIGEIGDWGVRTGTIDFEAGQGPVLVAVATSFISQAQAELNLEQEIGSKSFQELLDEGKATWAQQLGRIRVEAVDENQLAVFYTNMWKAMLFPRYLQEVNKHGEEVHRSPYTGKVNSGKLVTDSGFWDSYRAVYQLQSMVFPDNLGHCINGWLGAYKEAHYLPEWPSPGNRDCMTSTMGDVVLADAIVKSKCGVLSGFDVNAAYKAIRQDVFVNSTDATSDGEAQLAQERLPEVQTEEATSRRHAEALRTAYIKHGFVPAELDSTASVSITLDNYVSDDAVASAAHVLGKHEDEQLLRARSKQYGAIFNKSNYFFQPKSVHGDWSYFDQMSWGNGFTEAGPWQYRFYVPHDVEGLNKLYDGRICEAIQSMMLHRDGPAFKVGSYYNPTHEMTELSAIQPDFGLYAHNNQPAHHILYVAKRAGCNSLADKYLRKVMQKLYTKRGWSGDEDNGEMASWYVLSALGVYALQGAKDELVLGSPAIKHATVQLPNGKSFIVDAQNQADNHVYVQSVTWTRQGGQPHALTGNVLKFSELMQGGTLKFIMGDSPKEGDTQLF